MTGTATGMRRSERLLVDVPVMVCGETRAGSSFCEETFTVTINAHGALLMLEAKVAPGQKLTLSTPKSPELRECHVAYAGPDRAGLAQVAVEFAQPAPEFWPVDSPPSSWNIWRVGT